MRRLELLAAAGLLLAAGLLAAQPAQAADAIHWLQRAAHAAHRLNYRGTFIYQQGNNVEASLVVHRGGAAEAEKVKSLDNALREVIRTRHEVRYYRPDSKTILVDQQVQAPTFPALLPQQWHTLAANYQISTDGKERYAGYTCKVINLVPKDNYRYGHSLCVEPKTGLILSAVLTNDKHDVVERFSFTQLAIGGHIPESALRPAIKVDHSWHTERSSPSHAADKLGHWQVAQLPPGFHEVSKMQRRMPGKKTPVEHQVYSDGLASVSVFIEPASDSMPFRPGLSQRGGIHVFVRQLGDRIITVLGEVPAATVRQMANGVAPA